MGTTCPRSLCSFVLVEIKPTTYLSLAVRIIFGNQVDLEIIAIIHDIPLLADRRDRQTRQMFIAMHNSSHCLYRLLLENSVEPAIHTLRKHKNYQVPFSRTSRFKNSFLLYALRYFQ